MAMQGYGTVAPRIGVYAPGAQRGLIGSAMASKPAPKKRKPRTIEVRAHVRKKPKKKR